MSAPISEATFRAVAELSPMAIYASKGSDQKALFINKAFSEIFGFSLEDTPTVGHWWIKAFPDEKYRQQVIAQWASNIAQADKNKTDVEALECVCTCKDGAEKIITWVGKAIGDEFWAFGYDLTQRRQAEVALQTSEEKYRDLFEGSREAIMTLEPPLWNFTSGNPATVEIFGAKSTAEFIALDPWKLSPERQPDGRGSAEKAAEMIEAALRDGTHFFEWTHRRIGGEEFIATVRLSRMQSAGKVFLQATVRDVTERVRADQALRASEAFLREAQAIAGLGSYVLDVSTGLVWRSSEMLDRVFGIDRAYERSLAGWEALIHPEDRAMMADYFKNEVLGRGRFFDKEYRIIRRSDQAERWVWGTGKVKFDARGRVVELRGTIQDITERKRAEDELNKSHSLLAAALESTADGILVVNTTGKVTLFNHRFLELWRIPEKLTAARDDAQLIQFVLGQLKDPEAFQAKVQELYHTPDADSMDELAFKDGRTFEHYSHPQRLGETIVGRVWSFRDITVCQQTEELLRKSEQEFRTLAEAVPQIVWATRPDGWNIYFNQRWVDYTGLTLEESYGHGWNKPFHPDDQQRAWDAWQNATQNDAAYSLECRLRCADGTYHWWLIRGEPLRDVGGKILKWFGTCTNIEDIKQAEVALQKSAEHFTNLFNNAEVGMFRSRLDGSEMLDINEKYLSILGRTREEIIGKPSTILWVDPREREEMVQMLKAKGSVTDFEFQLLNKTGETRNCLTSLKFYPETGILDGSLTDITERKLAEEKIRNQLEELRRWYAVMLDREDRVQELKREVNDLCSRFHETVRYPSQSDIPSDDATTLDGGEIKP